MMGLLTKLDVDLLLFIQDSLRFPILSEIMRRITLLGDGGFVWIVFIIILLCIKSYRKTGITMTWALIIGFVITNLLLKNIVQRIRPYEVIEGLLLLVEKASDWSFPSGHSTSSMAVATVMFRMLPKKYGVPALALGIVISLSRLYVGIHYPSDVLAGMAIGICSAVAALYLSKKF